MSLHALIRSRLAGQDIRILVPWEGMHAVTSHPTHCCIQVDIDFRRSLVMWRDIFITSTPVQVIVNCLFDISLPVQAGLLPKHKQGLYLLLI